jgi:hypothetical protein
LETSTSLDGVPLPSYSVPTSLYNQAVVGGFDVAA